MRELRMILGDEFWLVEEPDGLVLCAPTVRRREGGGAPGMVKPAPRVLRKGQRITLTLHADPTACRGCEELTSARERLTRTGTWPWPKDHVFEHDHGQKEANG